MTPSLPRPVDAEQHGISPGIDQPNGRDSRRFRWAVSLAVLAILGLTVLQLADALPHSAHFGDVATLVAALIASIASASAALRRDRDQRGWVLLTVAVVVWTTAQAIWTARGFLVGHVIGELTVADIGFLAYSIPAIAGLLAFRRGAASRVTSIRRTIDALVIASAMVFISWTVVLRPAMSLATMGALESAVGFAYPLVDAAVASMVLFLAMRQPAGARLPWALLACGLITLTATDTAYLSISLTGRFADFGMAVNTGWIAALLLVSLAAVAPRRRSTVALPGHLTRSQELVPYLPVGVAVVCAASVDVFDDPFLPWWGIVVMILVTVRQLIIIAEKDSLALNLESRVEERTAELRHAQEDLSQTFDNAPIGMIWATLDGRIVRVNVVFCSLLGRSEEELVGSTIEAITVPGDLVAGRDLAEMVSQSHTEIRIPKMEKRYVHKDGSYIWTEVSLFVTKTLTGAPKYFVAQVQDISGERAATRAQANQATFLQAILENLDSGVMACDAQGNLTIVNRALRQMYGGMQWAADPADWEAGSTFLYPDGARVMPVAESPLARALRGEQVSDFELLLQRGDGPRRTLIANGHSIRDADGGLLGAVVALHDITERRAAKAALSRQALHDPLTDLANRALLRDRLEHAISRQTRRPDPLALLLLDLDGFKLVNDSLGHQAGDAVLISLAERLRSCLRPDDTIARLGGDEFAVVLENTSEAEATSIAGQILAEVRKPLMIEGHSLTPDASVGIMISTDVDSPESLLRNADLAMYAAKDSGKGNVQVFKAAMHETVLERLTLDAELRLAIEHQQFSVAYQPIVSLRTGELQGFEALVRWENPMRGWVSPATFVPLAESSGLIVPLGKWVLRAACAQAAEWRRTIPGTLELSMSVNLSVRQLRDPGFFDIVAEALADFDQPAELLHLEITESIFEHRGETIHEMLDRLHDIGVRLIVDDFGTGYSSLSRLHSLPIDKVKIDKSFVDLLVGGGPAPMVSATISMAHSLGLQAVAEGVESLDQVPFLLLHQCDDAQGYLFGRPLFGPAMGELLRERSGSTFWKPNDPPPQFGDDGSEAWPDDPRRPRPAQQGREWTGSRDVDRSR